MDNPQVARNERYVALYFIIAKKVPRVSERTESERANELHVSLFRSSEADLSTPMGGVLL